MHKTDQHRNLNQRTDHSRERNPRPDAEHRDRNRNCELKVIPRRRKRKRRRPLIIRAHLLRHQKAHEEHHNEVNRQRNRDPEDIQRQRNNLIPLQTEHHKDRKQQRHKRHRRNPRQKTIVVPLVPLDAAQHQPCHKPRKEGDPQINHHTLENFNNRNDNNRPLKPYDWRQPSDKHPSIQPKKQHLKDAVERNKTRSVITAALRKIIPNQHHRDASRQPNHDQPDHVLRIITQKNRRKPKHEHRTHDPVLDQ